MEKLHGDHTLGVPRISKTLYGRASGPCQPDLLKVFKRPSQEAGGTPPTKKSPEMKTGIACALLGGQPALLRRG